ncbi:hypothetical protein C0Q70_10178 [Pomacea canaliculata]|uniref:Uncharacterized protein n=1 Tax=Pomacea canaliculata TaxID=400727 RepID=A0A2T7PBV4_POMCA|nr:hypothetical protein C0Q70_10178 [Pomacea canaliculata]
MKISASKRVSVYPPWLRDCAIDWTPTEVGKERKGKKTCYQGEKKRLITSASDGPSRSFVYSDELTVGSQRSDKLTLMRTVATSEGHQRIRINKPSLYRHISLCTLQQPKERQVSPGQTEAMKAKTQLLTTRCTVYNVPTQVLTCGWNQGASAYSNTPHGPPDLFEPVCPISSHPSGVTKLATGPPDLLLQAEEGQEAFR